jgi:hypothetical protein
VDGAVFDYFASVGSRREGDAPELLEAAERQLHDARTLHEDAETHAHAAAEAIQRISRDYARGALSAESFEELKPQLVAELEAAEPRQNGSASGEERLLANPERSDLEEELLAELARIRAAVAGEVNDAQGVGAVRAAVLCLFEAFIFHADVFESATTNEAGFVAYGERRHDVPPSTLQPVLRPGVLARFEGATPVFKRAARATNNGDDGLRFRL